MMMMKMELMTTEVMMMPVRLMLSSLQTVLLTDIFLS